MGIGSEIGSPPQRRFPMRSDRVSDLCASVAERGESALTEAELVELVTAADAETVTRSLVDRGIRGLLRLTSTEAEALGYTPTQSAKLRALASIADRSITETLTRGEVFKDGATVFRHFHAKLRDLKIEQFHAVLLDGKHRVIRVELVSQGTLTSSPVHPRETFVSAVRHSAAAIIFVHNHPSGDPSPSADDLETTRRLCSVGDLLGIRVLDHVIVGDGAFTSLADRGLLR